MSESSQEPIMLTKSWDGFVIIIAYSVSALGAYTTLQIINQTRTKASSLFTEQMWLLFASVVFGGCAVWSMHFLGMMALDLGIKVSYEPILTLLSLAVPVAASNIAFQLMRFNAHVNPPHLCTKGSKTSSSNVSYELVSTNSDDDTHTLMRTEEGSTDSDEMEGFMHKDHPRFSRHFHRLNLFVSNRLRLVPCWRIVLGGVFLAIGIFAMHFVGMIAMRMNATVSWNWGYIITSFFIAWMAASTSLYIVSFCYLLWQQFVAALLMSLAVSGMHFVGMASATYYEADNNDSSGSLVLSENFSSIISIVSTITSFVFFGLASGNTTMARDKLEREIELRKTMEKLMLEKEAAELADRTKTAFVATVSHEIRTPMNIIIGATELLTSTKQSEEQKELTNTIQASSRGLLSMINDILDFSKLNSNRMQLESLGFSTLEVVEDIVSMSSVSLPADVDLLLKAEEDATLKVLGDPVRFQQVILNIVSNAIKFTEKGFIAVNISCNEKTPTSCRMCISIEDSGIGISHEACDKIFEPFVQADNSYARRFGGTGLGLSVCKQLVELMGGVIQLKSQVGKGTVFHIILPFALDVAQAKVLSKADAYHGLHCLLICRTDRSHDVIKSFLKKWGIVVHRPNDKNYVGKHDIIIVDVELYSRSILKTCDKLIIITNSRRKKPEGVPVRTVYIRRPVFEERLFSSIAQTIRNGAAPSPFTSPITSPNTTPSGSPTAPRPLVASPAKILLVEDNKLVQQIAIRLLGKLGLDVEVAENGQEAVMMTTNMCYFAVFMDCQMPVMDGFEATRQIRRMEAEARLPRTKIIALTAGVSEELKRECLEAGMDTYITKPVTLNMLQHALGLKVKI